MALGLSAVLVLGPVATGSSAGAVDGSPSPWVDLRTAEAFSVLGGTGVTSTGTATVLAKDLGLSPTGTISGFPPGTVTGATHDKDPVAETAQTDRQTAYDEAAGLVSTGAFEGDQAGRIFKAGVHTSAAAITNTGTMTLDADGDSSAVFVFQVGAALSSAAASKVVLTDGALANNVFWQVVGAVSMGAGAKSVGTFLAAGAVAFGEGSSLKGRVLTPGTVTLANTPVSEPKDDLTAPVVTIDAGATRSTNDTTPMIAGTADEPAGRSVRVTLDGPTGQVLTTTVGAGGAWAVSATTLAQGPHDVVASVTDASQNLGTATQLLTVDTSAPTVSIDGGALRATDDTTPTLAGTSDEPAGTPVTVTVAGQSLTSTATADGSWSVDAGPLSESAHSVVASVDDPAGSTGTATQILVVDLTAPVIAINGGGDRWTVDTSPWTYGTTGEQAGTTVRLTIGGQSLTAVVQSGGTWSVSATDLPEGSYPVVASISDAAQNTSTARQNLTIGGQPPAARIDIDGGATRASNDATPTISGGSEESTDATVTVTVAGQTLTSGVATDGSWSVDAGPLSEGGHNVSASVEAPSGSTGTATQRLIVDLTSPVLSIDSGATRSTDDTTPWVSGTTSEQAGTTVHVTVGGQHLTADALNGGAWGVTATALTTGSYPVVATIFDAAQNTSTAHQTLVVTDGPVGPDVRHRPDGAIRSPKGAFVGVKRYGANQRVSQLLRTLGTATYEVRLTNRGDVGEALTVLGAKSTSKFTVAYLAGGSKVTRAVTAGTYRTARLSPGRSATLLVKVTPTRAARVGDTRTFPVRAASTNAPAVRDTVAAVVKRRR